MHEPTKVCSTCDRELPVSSFHRRRVKVAAGVRASCKDCTNAKKRADRAESRTFTEEERQKERVRAKTRAAIAAGRLIPKPCEECGSDEVEAHHPSYEGADAYATVQWLCKLHHAALHGKAAWTNQIDLPL